MKKFNITTLAVTLAVALAAGSAQAAATSEVAYGSLTGSTITFSSLTEGDIDGLLTLGGVQFGERFDGQELAYTLAPRVGSETPAQDRFDNLSFGSPLAGLTLLAGAAGANLGAYDYGDAHGVALFGAGADASYAAGLGAISARFGAPVSALGFQLRDVDGGAVTLSLYRLDGSLIEHVDLSGRSDGFFAFARSGGTADIAGFSLTNSDGYYGVSMDNLVLSAAPVPEPGSYALMLAGMAVVAGIARRRRSNKL
ncbi:MAG TPA: PEP-CTERM sorting domain-containing protein [Roseateles sp.]